MSVLKKRTEGAWHDPIAYAGSTGRRPSRAPANDNRDARVGRSRSLLRTAVLLAAFGLAAALAASGAALGW